MQTIQPPHSSTGGHAWVSAVSGQEIRKNREADADLPGAAEANRSRQTVDQDVAWELFFVICIDIV